MMQLEIFRAMNFTGRPPVQLVNRPEVKRIAAVVRSAVKRPKISGITGVPTIEKQFSFDRGMAALVPESLIGFAVWQREEIQPPVRVLAAGKRVDEV